MITFHSPHLNVINLSRPTSVIVAFENYLHVQQRFIRNWKYFDKVEPAHVSPIAMPLPNDKDREYSTGALFHYPPDQKAKAYICNGGHATAETTCILALSLNTVLVRNLKFAQQYDFMGDLFPSC